MSSEHDWTTEADVANQWDRLADELRACKESQRRTWGDLDDATLGRYLAGEASTEEFARVENELHERPELRKLTDLVRDVLAELGPVEAVPPPAPRLLSFENARKRRSVLEFVRRRSPLVAAACLLVILGVAMPNPGFLSAPLGDPGVAPGSGMASRAMVLTEGAEPDAPALRDDSPRERSALPTPRPGSSRMVARAVMPRSAPPQPAVVSAPPAMPAADAVQFSGKRVAVGKHDGPQQRPVAAKRLWHVTMTPERAVALQREGNDLRKRGDLVAAKGKLAQTYFFCKDNYGDQHEATKNLVCSLADVYAAGLNVARADHNHATVMLSANGSTEAFVAQKGAPNEQANVVQMHMFLSNQPVQEIDKQVVPILTAALQSASNASKRWTYVEALGQLGPAARSAVPALARRLEQTRDAVEAKHILLTLEKMGEAASPALPTLTKLTKVEQEKKHIEEALANRIVNQLQGSVGRVGVRDDVGCFSLGVLQESCKQLCQLAEKSGVEVYVETRPALRPDPKKRLGRMGPRAVYVAIEPKGPTVQVHLSETLRKAGFNAEPLREQVLAACRDRKFDEGLRSGVNTIQARAERMKK